MSEPRFIVGIDLGTTHTVVAYVRAGDPTAKPAIFEIDQLIAPGEIAPRPLLHSLRYHPAGAELSEAQQRLPWERPEIPEGAAPYVIGELARELGAKVPGRLVVSAKSWLSHAGVDRTAAILPWGAEEGVPKISPVDASASYLAHVREAWDRAHPTAPLAEQEVVLTIPASFDEGARALTLAASKRAGIPRVHLLEEPQAAFYDWLGRQEDVAASAAETKLAIVVDVGGGTTDLTLVRVEHRESGPRLTRIAVGDHLMLGGDNMDLALAQRAEQQLQTKLPAARFSQLLVQARRAKETLLGESPPERAKVTVLGSGSKLVGGSLSTEIARADVETQIVDGFFPLAPVDARPSRRATAIVELGLPYVADAAVTRHVAAFVSRHQDVAKDAVGDALVNGLALPDAVLLNGGVFRGAPIAQRMIDVLSSWRGAPIRVLDNAEPELAVARGAALYGLARRGLGMKIGGGSARSYFLLLDGEGGARRGLCVLPRGAEEGEEVVVRDRTFALRLGQPVRFSLASSTGEAAYVRPGEIVDVDDELFRELPPIAAVLDDVAEEAPRSSLAPPSFEGPRASQRPGSGREERVRLAAALTEIGTLEVSCIAESDAARRWKLELELRGQHESELAPSRVTQLHPRYAEARAKIEAVYGKSEADSGKAVKTLRADLEKILGPREKWPMPLLRELFGALLAGVKRRRRSADHERVWFNLAGYTLRPGVGYPLDDFRAKQLFAIFEQGVQFAPEAQNWSEWWTLWRRVAGGLDDAQQEKVLSAIDWYLHPPTPRPRPRPAGPKALGYDDMVRLAASLERISAAHKERIGGWMLERVTKHGEGPFGVWALGRIGARVPLYGSAHTVVARVHAQAWLGAVLALDWKQVEPAAFAATMLARKSGDRTRDVDAPLAAETARRLRAHGAPEVWAKMVEEVAVLGEDTVARLLGESLPPGLALVE
ncbi:MAG: Hsp70 family protein [Sandaracinus sp.]